MRLHLLACFLVLVGGVLIYVINRRRFIRRSVTGMERFFSFGGMVLVKLLEFLLKLLGVLMVVGGLLLLILDI